MEQFLATAAHDLRSPPHRYHWLPRPCRAHVTVCDQGPGIPEGERSRAWELFHRIPSVTAQSGTQGCRLGLGLHISKAITEDQDQKYSGLGVLC